MESGVLRGQTRPPKRFCRTFWGSATSCGGSNLLTPVKCSPAVSIRVRDAYGTLTSVLFYPAGCFKKVFINGRMFDFTSITTQFKVLPGCSDVDLLSTTASSDPCESHMCRNGRCRAVNETNYVCKCRRGYSGPMCDVRE